jgi:GNAT superfamily N-acetyltransferase
MSTRRVETAAGDLPLPPFEFTDGDGREVLVAPYGEREGPDGDPDGRDEDFEALYAMYDGWPRGEQSQGIPPVTRERTEAWLREVLDGVNAVAWHEDSAVGHAMLIPDEEGGNGGADGNDGDDEPELAVFVRPRHQNAGIGRRLVEGVLALGYREGVRHVWLTVGSWNGPARRLYGRLGFETTGFSQPVWLEKGPDAHIATMELDL